MSSYNGIPINEFRLVGFCILFFVLFFALAVTLGYWLHLMRGQRNEKTEKRIRKLKQRAAKDPRAARLLELEQDRIRRRRRKNRSENAYNIVLFAIASVLACCILIFGVLSPLLDYCKKDYVVYTGVIQVHDDLKHPYIELEDGTQLRGAVGLTEEDTFATVVYAKRSKLTLGGQ